MTYPVNNPEWALEDTYLDGVTPNKIRPDESLRNHGYSPLTELSAQELNWQLNNLYQQILELKTITAVGSQLPIGTIIELDGVSDNPSVLLGYGTWIPFAQGRTTIGAGTGTDVNGVQRSFSAGGTGGEYVHSISNSEMPQHNHTHKDRYLFENNGVLGSVPTANKETVGFINGGAGNDRLDNDNNTMVFLNDVTGSSGSGQAMNIVQPYLVTSKWKRTA